MQTIKNASDGFYPNFKLVSTNSFNKQNKLISFIKTPLLARRGGTNESAPKVLTNELACRRQVTGWWNHQK